MESVRLLVLKKRKKRKVTTIVCIFLRKAPTKNFSPQIVLQFAITGLVETASTYLKQVEKDFRYFNEVVQLMGLRAEGNVTGISNLRNIANANSKENTVIDGMIAKSNRKENFVTDEMITKPNSEDSITVGTKRCRPLLVTISNSSYFVEKCFARSHYLQNYKFPNYIEKVFVFYRWSSRKR